MREEHKCPICGEVTSSYMGNYRKDGLCKQHSTAFKNGTLVQDENGKWCFVSKHASTKKTIDKINLLLEKKQVKQNNISIEKQVQPDNKCIVCHDDASEGPLCRECYFEMLGYKEDYDKNSKVFELTDHYFNLRSAIYRMETFDAICTNCKKLMALAVLTKELYHNNALTDRVVSDIKEIIDQKSPKVQLKITKNAEVRDAHREELKRTMDGHYVKSQGESIIDDIFYENKILHCYEKKVHISTDEPAINADWFIPVTDIRHGIYVEYWGMNTGDYLKNKERKRKQYKEHDIPLVEIEKDDVNDKHGLTDRLLGEINMLAEKYYRVHDFLK